nr:M24 family metallopeptidase [Bacillus subtilis]
MKKGDFVLFDLGVILDGYCSDITRTFAYKTINPKQEAIYETVLQAEKAAIEASKPGVRIGDLDLTARGIIEKAGYGDYFPHRLGHGLGISVHEYPSMSQVPTIHCCRKAWSTRSNRGFMCLRLAACALRMTFT